ncbi:uncharacterized protein LOC127856608 [Dreissena polymorpha]|uniref:uncharacterized protein LOC127856608 n=1 Tax=Dreissena polymorpha TaxID=45954 RepID=UPI002264B8E8|nr:uncharacterized protein LOC127856608 [Dreissena polymorpha]
MKAHGLCYIWKFLSRHSAVPAYDSYATQCERFDPVIMSARYTQPYQVLSTTTTSSKIGYPKPTSESSLTLPEDQPINDSSVGGPANVSRETISDPKPSPGKSDPWKLVTLLRVVIVNIFLGLLIVALLLAIGFVCYRYISFGRERRRNTIKSETQTTLDDNRSTELHLLSDDKPDGQNLQDANHKQETVVHTHVTSNQNDPQSVLTPYETMIFKFNCPGQAIEDETAVYDTATGVSTFMPQPVARRVNGKLANTEESAYSSFDDEQPENYSEFTDLHGIDKDSLNPQNVKMVADLIEHRGHKCDPNKTADDSSSTSSKRIYEVPEYRVVSSSTKDPKQRNEVNNVRNSLHANHTNYSNKTANNHADQNHYGEIVVKVGNNVSDHRHIQVVPEEGCHHSSSSTTMQLIPEHKCLLHNIPPPPPPPSGSGMALKGRNSWSALHADV